MKRFLAVVLSLGALLILAGVAAAQFGHGSGHGVRGVMGHGGKTGHQMEAGPHTGATATQVTEEKARALAQQYADKYLAGFKVERILPTTGMHHTMYSVELKNPKGELRSIHITPFGGVMPFSRPLGHGQGHS